MLYQLCLSACKDILATGFLIALLQSVLIDEHCVEQIQFIVCVACLKLSLEGDSVLHGWVTLNNKGI